MDDAAKYEIDRLRMELRRRDAMLETLRHQLRLASSDLRDADDRIIVIAGRIVRHGYDRSELMELIEAFASRDAVMKTFEPMAA